MTEWRCLAPTCDETGDGWTEAVEHRRSADHPDYGETFGGGE